MLVTADTSHADMSWLKDCAYANIPYMLVTADTSHDPIGPCAPAEQLPTGDSLMHAPTASWSSILLWGANTVATVLVVVAAVLVMVAAVMVDAMDLAVVVVAAVVVHTVDDIDPGEPINMLSFFAFDCTQ